MLEQWNPNGKSDYIINIFQKSTISKFTPFLYFWKTLKKYLTYISKIYYSEATYQIVF